MILSFTNFMGVAPAIAPSLLADNAAQTATNTDLFGGSLRAFIEPTTVATPAKPGTKLAIHRFGKDALSDAQYWFTWTTAASVVRGLIAADTNERTYYTGDGAPKVTDSTLALTGTSYPQDYYTLGVPAPTAAPIVTPDSTAEPVENRAYVYTFVTAWGEESAPSPAQTTTINSSAGASLSGLQTAPAGDYNITAKRVYRTVTTDTGTDYYYITEVPIATTTATDTGNTDDLGEPLPTLGWDIPPTDLDGLVMLYDGMLGGFHGKEVCISEPYAPYAWPAAYRITVDYDVVGLAPLQQSFLVLTKGTPYMVFGTDPGNMVVQKLELDQACVSRRSIVRVGNGVVYASPDGLVYIDNATAKLATQGIFRRAEWQALVPSSIHGVEHDGKYYGFYNTGSVSGGFIFNPGSGSFNYLDFYADAAFAEPQNNALYFAIGADIKKWNTTGSKLTYTWKSKLVQLPAAINLACGKVICGSYSPNPTLKVYADGVLKHTQTVTNNETFWLPSGFRARTWEVQIEGVVDLYAIHLASGPDELKGVV